ncbi:Crp/Fnr family transcriptional regulator [Calidifontibacillus oryziterrae]|uniref:Crp/Fnr family transcriptional regulator n=1 Tax=Calidifontibacillus oryziterrae TaxID=1191699 RepID=UPI00031AEA5A|nr:Crp/Fnr family transcriptional regulator [Calidifontibacillus oryziterrae]
MEKIYTTSIFKLFPFFKDIRFENDVESLFVTKVYPKGTKVFDEGDHCGGVAFLLSGRIRVSKIGKNGREVILYRIKRGDTCILTISSVLSGITYPATATVEEEVEVVILTVKQFKALLARNSELQQFVYRLLSERFLEVVTLMDEIIFRKTDDRLIEFLLSHTQENGDIIEKTHDEIATELGTAREVVSRIMKSLERNGFIQISRGRVRITNRLLLAEKLSEF